MSIQQQLALKQYNTMGIDVMARYFASFTQVESLQEYLAEFRNRKKMVLGGGSNILFLQDYEGLVLHNDIKGIEWLRSDDEHVYLKVGAGENWHGLVEYCIDRNLAGMENLALIPGRVGASPIQNIGAYGVELKEVFDSLEAVHMETGEIYRLGLNEMEFGYRDSIFKGAYRGQFVITYVTYRLHRTPRYHIEYGAIREELEKMSVQDLSIRAVAEAVMRIRRSKLPDPALIGNAGSFFKNPLIPIEQYQALSQQYSGIPSFPAQDGWKKLAAGWLIEQCGWKGYRKGDAGCHERQALVLVNFGQATGLDIYELSEEILQSVWQKFGVMLEREVNII